MHAYFGQFKSTTMLMLFKQNSLNTLGTGPCIYTWEKLYTGLTWCYRATYIYVL